MDLYLTDSRHRPAPLGLAVVAIIGMIIWAFTAQGKAAASSADRPSETAHRLDSLQALAIDDLDDLDDVNANDDDSESGGGGAGEGGTDSSGGGGGGGETSGGGDETSGGGDETSGGGDETSGGGDPPPGGSNPPPTVNNPPPAGGVLGGNPPTVVLPNTAITADSSASTGLVGGLVVLAAAGATGLRRFVGGRVEDH